MAETGGELPVSEQTLKRSDGTGRLSAGNWREGEKKIEIEIRQIKAEKYFFDQLTVS